MNLNCIFNQHEDCLAHLRETELGLKYVFQCIHCHRRLEHQTILSKEETVKLIKIVGLDK